MCFLPACRQAAVLTLLNIDEQSHTHAQVEGITIEVLATALAKAREARRHILAEMELCSPPPRRTLAPTAPRILRFNVDPEKIGLLIGPGGRTIRGLIEASGVDDIKVCGARVPGFMAVRSVPAPWRRGGQS
jgi:hypothetical protein